ncbi:MULTISPECIES: hypothetical protein [Snodgrassella]|uniref:hypothetical protein n=1 Tax=Snodgrassella TaxID=1193515 RepID=UPI0008157C30|nr:MULTISPECIES: hypothetical protein [Snodgrassella]MCO6520889.1 hypothetical protein [Snodgrassella sp.]SCC12876.1 hypothetical protein GA0061082_11030 [Snodgrassella sp. R-53583]
MKLKRIFREIARNLAYLMMLGWLPLLVFYFVCNPELVVIILATVSCIAAFAGYGYVLLLLLYKGITDLYEKYSPVLRTIKENREVFNQFVKWAKENDKKII